MSQDSDNKPAGPETIGLLEQWWATDKSRGVFVRLAQAYLAANRGADAVQICREGLAVHPASIDGRHLLARALVNQGEAEAAEKVLLEAVEFLVEKAEVLGTLARLYDRQGQADKARLTASAYLALNPDDQEIRGILGPGPAKTDQQPAAPGRAEPAPTATLAELYYNQGHLDQARQMYRRLLETEPDNDLYRTRLAELELGQKGPGVEAPPEIEALSQLPPEVKKEVVSVLEDWLNKAKT
jgi:tetratricopeptide (TPR) repeat protein